MKDSVPRLTREQAAIVGVYTGIVCGPFEDFHKTVSLVMGYSVLTHEMGSARLMEEAKKRIKPKFLELCAQDSGPGPFDGEAGK